MPDFRDHIVAAIPRLRRFAISLAGNVSDGDDLMQCALERAIVKQHTYKPELKIESWLFKITQNLWIDQKRSDKRRGIQVPVEDTPPLKGEDGNKVMENRNMAQKVFSAIHSLPEEQQLVVSHVLVDGQSYQEAADILDLPIGTVMSRLHRARKTLEAKLTPQTNHQTGPGQ